jgi:hypothetical protein
VSDESGILKEKRKILEAGGGKGRGKKGRDGEKE